MGYKYKREGITFFDGASGKKCGKGCRSSLMTKTTAIAFENSPRKIFIRPLLLIQRLKLAPLLLDSL
tara:strand:+ start:300 stop:500 length:201 start_codon:yes stop_codon:yes gene_type:complete